MISPHAQREREGSIGTVRTAAAPASDLDRIVASTQIDIEDVGRSQSPNRDLIGARATNEIKINGKGRKKLERVVAVSAIDDQDRPATSNRWIRNLEMIIAGPAEHLIIAAPGVTGIEELVVTGPAIQRVVAVHTAQHLIRGVSGNEEVCITTDWKTVRVISLALERVSGPPI